MNKITAVEHPFYAAESLSTMNQPMPDVETLDTPDKTNALLGFLGQLTTYSYDAWLTRDGMQDAME